MTEASKDKVRRFRQRADKGDVIESDWGEFVLYADFERLQRKLETCGLQCSATLKSLVAENERLRTTLTGIASCSTCEMCRGAAEKALGEEPTPRTDNEWKFSVPGEQGQFVRLEFAQLLERELNAAYDTIIERCLARIPVTGECRPVFDRSQRSGTCTACGKTFTCGAALERAAQPPGDSHK